MNNDGRRPVAVGVDGSESSLAAATHAAEEAAYRDLPLELVHAYLLPLMLQPMSGMPVPPAGELDVGDPAARERAERLLHNAAARVRSTHPDLPILTRLRDGHPAEVLVDASRQSTMVVVGHRGWGGFAGLLVGSVAIQVANHAATPAIVVRGELPRTGPVVVGVDGSDGSLRAAVFAAEEAAVRNAALVAMYAWPVDSAWQPPAEQLGEPPPVPDDVTETLAAVASQFPSVTVEPKVHTGKAHELLIEASENAQLVVVGSRGRGGFQGLLLGSVSQALINHAHCPVAVVGPAAEVDVLE